MSITTSSRNLAPSGFSCYAVAVIEVPPMKGAEVNGRIPSYNPTGSMRIRVSYTTTVDSFYRAAIRHHYGKGGFATRQEVKDWLWAHGQSMDDDITRTLTEAIRSNERTDLAGLL